MKIFRISSWKGQAGGAQLYIKTVNHFLQQEGYETYTVNIVTEEPDSNLVDGEVIKVGESVATELRLNVFPSVDFITDLYSRYLRFSPDLVTIHSYGSPFLQIGEFIKKVTVPVIFNAHDALLVCPINTLTKPDSIRCEGGIEFRCFFTGCQVGPKLAFDLVKRYYFDVTLLGKISAFICPSRSLAEYLHAHGYRPAIHLPSFVSDPDLIPENKINGKLKFGYIGRLEPWKGVQYLLNAFRIVVNEYDSVDLVIAGKGPYESKLKDLTLKLGIVDKVKFIGNVSGQDKEDFYSQTNVIVIPSSTWENHPLVAIEAQLRKRPVIGTDFGGIKEIIQDGKTGQIVPIADHLSLSSAMLKFARNKDLISEYGNAGRERSLSMFTPGPHIKMLTLIYDMVARGKLVISPMEALKLINQQIT